MNSFFNLNKRSSIKRFRPKSHQRRLLRRRVELVHVLLPVTLRNVPPFQRLWCP